MKYIISLILIFACTDVYAQAVAQIRSFSQLTGTPTIAGVTAPYIAQNGGTGTGNILTNANLITPTISYVQNDNGYFTNIMIASGTGTLKHLIITDSLTIGTASTPGLVKQTNGTATGTQLTSVQINSGTATLSGVASPYIAQTGGTASGLTLSGTNIINGVTAPYIAQTSGTGSGNTLNNTKLSGNTAIGTTTAATDVVDIDLGSGNMLIQSNSSYPQTQEIRGGAAADGNLLATKIYQGKDSAGNSTNYAGIYAVSSNVTNGSEAGSIDFYLSDAGSYALRGRWKGANLGIGTSTPANKLTVVGTIESTSGGVRYPDGNTQTEAVTQLVKGIAAGTGISIDQSTGTVTVTNTGLVSAGGWTDGTNTVYTTVAADQVIIGSTTAASNQILTVVGSQTTTDLNVKNAMSLAFTGTPTIDLAIGDNDTGLEQSADNVLAMVAGGASTLVLDGATNRVRIGTSTSNTTLQVGGTITASSFSGSGQGLTGIPVAFSDVTGSATGNTNFSQIPVTNVVKAPVSANNGKLVWNWMDGITGTVTTQTLSTSLVSDPTSIFLFHMDGTSGTNTFTNTGYGTFTVTANGNAQISTVSKKFGNGSGLFDGTGDFLVLGTSPLFDIPAGSTWDFSTQINPTTVASDDGIITMGATTDSFFLMNRTSNMRMGMGTQTLTVASPSAGTWTQIYVSYDGKIGRLFYNGTQQGTLTVSDTYLFTDNNEGINLAEQSSDGFTYDGYMDEVRMRLSPTTNFHTSNFNPDNVPYAQSDYTETTVLLNDSLNNINLLKFVSPGTATTETSYTFFPGSLTAFGYGTTTGMSSVGSSNVYSTESKNAEIATNFIVKSKDAKGRNFEEVTINALDRIGNTKIMSWNPTNHKDMYRMDAEAIAKEAFIRQNKDDWKSLHELEYVSQVVETGTGTINVIDSVKLDKAYKDYIELEWASSPEQTDWTNTVEDNAESDLTMRNYGLRLDDPATPNELRKPAGIGLMDWNALNTKAIQELIAALGSATAEIAKLKAKVNP